MGQSIADRFPFHLTIGEEDFTFLLDEGFTFSNVDPGGYEMASFPIPHDMPQILRGMKVKLDSGMQVAWEGRVKEVQRSLGAKTLIQCEGYGAKLRDESLSMVYVDRDLSRWTGPGIQRTTVITSGGFVQGNSNVGADAAGNPALVQMLPGNYNGNPIVDNWYDAGPQNLTAIIYFKQFAQSMPNSWSMDVYSCATDANVTTLINGFITSPHSEYCVSGTARRYWNLESLGPNANNQGGAQYQSQWEKIAVYGTHGLTRRGSDPGGFYTSDIVEHALSTVSGIQAGEIPEADFYIVPHAVYYTPVEVQQVIADMAKLVGFHWGVWESLNYLTGNPEPRLDFRPYPTTYTAFAFRSECEALDIREDLSSQYNVAQVSFSAASGSEESVRVEVDNPILDAANISERVLPLNLGTSNAAAAEAYGKLALEISQQQARVVGSAIIKDAIHSTNGASLAPWMLKSGIDRIRIPDLPSADVWGAYNELPITRVECSGSSSGFSTSLEFGEGPNLLEALTSELQQATTLA